MQTFGTVALWFSALVLSTVLNVGQLIFAHGFFTLGFSILAIYLCVKYVRSLNRWIQERDVSGQHSRADSIVFAGAGWFFGGVLTLLNIAVLLAIPSF